MTPPTALTAATQDVPRPQETRRAGQETLVLLSVAHFFIDLYSSALGALQPVIAARLGISLSQAGVLGGLLVFSSSTTQPAYGYLSDRYQSKLFTALAPAVAGIFISLIGLAPSYWSVVALVLLGGAGISSFHPQGSSRAVAGIQQNRGRWMAVFISSGTLGLAFGPTFFSALIGQWGAQRTWAGMVPGILVTLILLLRLPEMRQERRRAEFDWQPLRAVWRPLTVLYLLVFIRSIVQISFTQFLPLYLTRERGMSLGAASAALSLYLASGAIGGVVGGNLSDRLGGRLVIMLSMVGSAPFLLLFFMTTGLPSMAGLALGGLTLLFTIPVNVTMGQELAPSQSGTVSALMMGFAWGTAGMLFIPLVGAVADRYTLHQTLSWLLVFPLIGFFLAQFGLPERRTVAA
jgi:FSR family fosmidomycin resistance protein-like MFS transporter